MKEFWIRLPKNIPIQLKKTIIEESVGRCDVIFVDDTDFELVHSMGVDKVASSSRGEIVIREINHLTNDQIMRFGEKDGASVTIQTSQDEEIALKAAEAGAKYIIINCPNWKVIPLENLIAKVHGKSKLIAEVASLEEAKTAIETLELGADGILFTAKETKFLDEIRELISLSNNEVKLIEAKVIRMKPLGMGARVCVDTCELMKHGEGMLVGCQSSGLFLAQAEVEVNPHVETRPFRVNAGPVSCYVLTPGNKTKYLSDLSAGDEVLIVDRNGKTRIGNIGRIKIESRPMILIEAESQGTKIKTVAQNAETIHLVTPEKSVSMSQLKSGDIVLVRLEEGGRHFGTLVKDEMVIER